MREKPPFWNGVERIQWGCALMRLLGERDLTHLSLVLAGNRSVERSRQVAPFAQAVRTARTLLDDLMTRQAVQNAVYAYNEAGEQEDLEVKRNNSQNRCFTINPKTLAFTSIYDDGLDPTITESMAILQQGLSRRATQLRMADTQKDLEVTLEGETRAQVRFGGLQFPPPERHDLARRPREPITVTLAELATCARSLDEADRAAHRQSESWLARLEAIDLQETTGAGLRSTQTLDLTDLKHLIGVPGSGKTTLITLLCVHLARQGRRVAAFFTSIEVATQYYEKLRRYEIEAAILMGRSGPTRRRHANAMAELIASNSAGGFGHTHEAIEFFATRCPLPAFAENLPASQWLDRWPLSIAPCESLRDPEESDARLCPAWAQCGRVKSQRVLLPARVWLGHLLSADTTIPAHMSAERMRYFELIAETFDLVIIDECDAIQSALDERGTISLNLTGSENSLHSQVQKLTSRLATNRMRITDGAIDYGQRAVEFEQRSLNFIAEIRTLEKRLSTQHLAREYADRLLTPHYLLDEALRTAQISRVQRRQRIAAIADFWERAMYQAYFARIEGERWRRAEKYASDLGMTVEDANSRWRRLTRVLIHYLNVTHMSAGEDDIEEMTRELVALMGASPDTGSQIRAQVRLLVVVGFVVASYQQLAKVARSLAQRGEVMSEEESMLFAGVSRELREHVPQSLVGAFSAVRYRKAPDGPGYEIDYLVIDLTPRLLLHRLHEIGRASVLLASATSWLEPSSEFHVDKRPDYVLRRVPATQDDQRSHVRLYFQAQRDLVTGKPLFFSGAGMDRDKNLRQMVTNLAQPDVDGLSELERAARAMLTSRGRHRKVALVVNSYEQVLLVVKHMHEVNARLGKHTRGVLREAPEGEEFERYTLRGQVESLGSQDDIEVIVFPITALGRGINIVYQTDDSDDGCGAVGSVYFLTRPHPAAGDLHLMISLLARDTWAFECTDLQQLTLSAIQQLYKARRYQAYKRVMNLLARPMAASRLDSATLESFAANLLVPILQTIGRGMRKGAPVSVYFVDAAWAPHSAQGHAETERSSVLVLMRKILRNSLTGSDPDLREVCHALYGVFRDAFDNIIGLQTPDASASAGEIAIAEGFDEAIGIEEEDEDDLYFDPSEENTALDFEDYDP